MLLDIFLSLKNLKIHQFEFNFKVQSEEKMFPPLPTPSDLHLFNHLNESLSTAISVQGSATELFAAKTFPPYSGMTNQGATCYLNSLIQSLYFLKPFREAVFKWRYNKDFHGSPVDSIPLQLQVCTHPCESLLLFSLLTLSHLLPYSVSLVS